jgi:hypothetical protein
MTAPTVDIRTLGQTLFIKLDNRETRLRPGGTVTAIVTPRTKPDPGVIIPRDAVVWHDGKAWVYSEFAENQFKRREITTDRALNDGWFISAPLAPNDRIVTQGAQQLLSEEFKPIIPPNVDVDD